MYFNRNPTNLVIESVMNTIPRIISRTPEIIVTTLMYLFIFLKNFENKPIKTLNSMNGIPSPKE